MKKLAELKHYLLNDQRLTRKEEHAVDLLEDYARRWTDCTAEQMADKTFLDCPHVQYYYWHCVRNMTWQGMIHMKLYIAQ